MYSFDCMILRHLTGGGNKPRDSQAGGGKVFFFPPPAENRSRLHWHG